MLKSLTAPGHAERLPAYALPDTLFWPVPARHAPHASPIRPHPPLRPITRLGLTDNG
ncbi:hypothetical protein [Acetobacter vaccinii]|uniref:hypothetical protein n=1 Tax=Acetobacter vaccinii TaxID=2592655 RepID=UPI00143DBC7C|nr:hypothetical protein [Acetobacter vaccinii]